MKATKTPPVPTPEMLHAERLKTKRSEQAAAVVARAQEEYDRRLAEVRDSDGFANDPPAKGWAEAAVEVAKAALEDAKAEAGLIIAGKAGSTVEDLSQ